MGTLARYADGLPENGDDFECYIHKSLLRPTYKCNPTVLAAKIQSQCQNFRDYSGRQAQDSNNEFIVITLFRERKPEGTRRTNSTTVKQVIKDWLATNPPNLASLQIPVDTIPPFLFTHPEHLAYQVYRETNKRIRINRHKTKWTILQKSLHPST